MNNPTPDTPRHIALVGMMGSGKTTVGRYLAKLIHWPYHDIDHIIERETGQSIAEIFDTMGEAFFRRHELEVIERLPGSELSVVSTGGGLFIQERPREILLTHAYCIYLQASPQVLWERVRFSENRPLLQKPDPQKILADLLSKRDPIYRLAHYTLNIEGKTIEAIAQEIVTHLPFKITIPPSNQQ
ncbi:MAG: shikimate kinase [Methylacidiphilales bacterium]|nr:shikimate kinase [Candidatus Methylacidiphilales bacterium]MDW8349592.1 shikimate kinase [Verrucomicrobiae bacterium]